MRKNLFVIGILFSMALVLSSCTRAFGNRSSFQNENQETIEQMNNQGYEQNGKGNGSRGMGGPNRGTCLADDCLLIEGLEYPAGTLSADAQEALKRAIDDEYKAMATYVAVIEKFGSIRPFIMIKGAEDQHIAALKNLFEKYGLEIPANPYMTKVVSPADITTACQLGVDAEIANATLYTDELLPKVSEYEDITQVFTNLMNASKEKHLPAFERCN